MLSHPEISILWIQSGDKNEVEPLLSYLKSIHLVKLTIESEIPSSLKDYDVIITIDNCDSPDPSDLLLHHVQSGGGWLDIHLSSQASIPAVFGVKKRPLEIVSELRVLFKDPDHPLAVRLPDAIYVDNCSHGFEISAEDTEAILYADWRYQHIPMLASRRIGDGVAACIALKTYRHPVLQQILYRTVRLLAGRSISGNTHCIGILGYAPSVGQYHGLGIEDTQGLGLKGICDLSPERLSQARRDFSGIKTFEDAEALSADPDIDLVIIATPPNTHAALALRMMEAGKHVIAEKPLALNRKETDALVEMSEKQGVHLSCHQNRRWDGDYLAIKQAVGDERIGELFYMETFVGGFHHPCGYWHSHDVVSGGTTYDWGAHYLDWTVSLIPDSVASVIGTRQNRVWHDVTNADQERIQIRFVTGKEAEFIHSDIAAVRKPKWYLLGTEGAIVGKWRDETTYAADPIHYYNRYDIPATEIPPELIIHYRKQANPLANSITTGILDIPERTPYSFHRNLADHLLLGEPLVAPLGDSLKVVAILEAAARSAEKGGTVEALNE